MLDEKYFAGVPGGPRHLTPEAFDALDAGELTDEERALMLAHLESCRGCMSDYIDRLADGVLLEPPDGLEERIGAAVRAEWTEELVAERRKKARIIQFTKLAVAVCLTVVVSVGSFQLTGILRGRNFVEFKPSATAQQAAVPPEQRPEEGENPLAGFVRGISQGFSQFADAINFGFNFGGDGNK